MKTTASGRCAEALRRLATLLLLAASLTPALAHKASDAYLQVDVQPGALLLRWDIALRDLDAALPALDADGNRALTWGELRASLPAVERYVLSHLQVPGCAAALQPQGHALERRSDGVYLALSLRGDCTAAAGVPLRYTLFAGLDATHRGIAAIRHADGRSEVRLLDPGADATGRGTAAADAGAGHSFLAEGVFHIVTGWDHLLFLLCLLLPVVLGGGRGSGLRVAGIVTLFTLAHSTTLALAALGHVNPPSSLVEPLIALTIVLAAMDNLVPLFGRWRAAVTFGFGLLHGFGFAGVLAELSLPAGEFAWALLRFNLGIELGQLAVLALAGPLLAFAGRSQAWRRALLQGGSVAAAALALFWVVERSAGLGA